MVWNYKRKKGARKNNITFTDIDIKDTIKAIMEGTISMAENSKMKVILMGILSSIFGIL